MDTQKEINRHVQLANAWFARGNLERASSGYHQAIEADANCGEAYYGLGRIALHAGLLEDALAQFEQALSFDPDDYQLQMRCDAIYEQLGGEDGVRTSGVAPAIQKTVFPANVMPKFSLDNQVVLGNHRSGWGAVLQALQPLHNPDGILFDGALEYNFLVRHNDAGVRSDALLEEMKRQGTYDQLATAEEMGIIPYRVPWVGFIHHTPNMPAEIEHYAKFSLQKMFAKPVWQESLDTCIGLFTLSEYNARWLRKQTGKPVSVVMHPTEMPDVQFDFERFQRNQDKKVVQIGWWMRRLNAIYRLPLPKGNTLNYTKIWLKPSTSPHVLRGLLRRDRQLDTRLVRTQLNGQGDMDGSEDAFRENTQEMEFISNDEYDQLLAENVAFVDLYDSSVNNTVIECIARATPLLVNPLPAVVEYLGTDYPFYFECLDDAAQKALDLDLIAETHDYLKNCPMRAKLDGQYFLDSIVSSEVYQLIE